MVSMDRPDLSRNHLNLLSCLGLRNPNPSQSINGMPEGIRVIQHRCNSRYNLMVRGENILLSWCAWWRMDLWLVDACGYLWIQFSNKADTHWMQSLLNHKELEPKHEKKCISLTLQWIFRDRSINSYCYFFFRVALKH